MSTDQATERVPRVVDRGAAWAWRLLVLGVAVAALLWLLGQMLVVVLPVVGALLGCRLLWPAQRSLLRRRWPAGLAAAAVTFAAVLGVVGAAVAVGATLASGADDLDAAFAEGLDDVETWLVEDAPIELSAEQVRDARSSVRTLLESTGDGRALTDGLALAGEVAAGLVLATILTFFFLKDGPSLVRSLERRLPAEGAPRRRRLAQRSWDALGGYLRGAALLGTVEAVVIGVTMAIVGAEFAAPVAAVTFVAAFVPVVGAVVAGVVAVVVTLASAGVGAALVVGAVALVVQQLDNDVLAPWIYGKTLRLPALAILLGVAVGVALFGLVGAFLAVPVLAVGLGVVDEWSKPGGVREPSNG